MFSNATTYVKGRHTFKAGVSVEYSGEDDFDQINVNSIPGRHEQPERPVLFPQQPHERLDHRYGARRHGTWATSTDLRRDRRTGVHQVAGARDRHLRPGFVEAAQQPDDRGRRALGDLAAVVLDDEQHRQLRPAVYDAAKAAVINPVDRPARVRHRATTASSCRATGSKGDGNDLGWPQDPQVQALFLGEPRGFAKTHYNVFEPRLGHVVLVNDKTIVRASAGVFHNRVTLNDSLLLGGNPPFQPMVAVNNGSVDNPAVPAEPAARTSPSPCRPSTSEFKHPTAYMWSAGVQREVPFGLRRRRDLRRPARALPPARAEHQPADPGTSSTGTRRNGNRVPPPLQGLQHDPSVGERGALDSTTACS